MAGRSFGGELVRGTMPLLVLSVLVEGELYGYEIGQRIRALTGDAFAPSEGALYPALHRLEADGALVASWRDSERGPRRRYYRITERGHGQLARHRREWETFSGVVRAVTAGAADA